MIKEIVSIFKEMLAKMDRSRTTVLAAAGVYFLVMIICMAINAFTKDYQVHTRAVTVIAAAILMGVFVRSLSKRDKEFEEKLEEKFKKRAEAAVSKAMSPHGIRMIEEVDLGARGSVRILSGTDAGEVQPPNPEAVDFAKALRKL